MEERDYIIRARRMIGETLQSIGSDYGMTRERVRQICEDIPAIRAIRSRLDKRITERCKQERVYQKIIDRFWSKVDKRIWHGCWEWQASVMKQTPYGRFVGRPLFGNEEYTHRQSFYLANGYIPEHPMWVLHDCGNPTCVNPKHLYEGTPKQNSADAVRHRGGTHWTKKD